MANASNIKASEWHNGTNYYNGIALQSAWTALYAGKISDSQNNVVMFQFDLASAATSITLSWYTTDSTFKGRPMYYHLSKTRDDSTYKNATNSNHGDGTLNTPGSAYTSVTNTISGTFTAGTYYLYIWQGATYGSDTYIHTSFFYSSASFPFTISYNAVASYTLSASVGTGITGFTATIYSSPYGRTGSVGIGGTILQGERLTISWSVSTGYTLATHTVNGSDFTSGSQTGSISSNVNVVLSAVQAVAVFNSVPSSYTTGSASTITVIRYSSAYTYTLEVVYGTTVKETLAISWSGNNGTVSWTPAVATYAPLNNIGNYVYLSLRLTTKSGATTLGTKTASISVNFTGVNPTPSLSVSDANGYYSTYGAYVQGRSAFYIVLTDGTKYGASASSRAITANGATYSSSPATTAPITGSGTLSITASVRDSRGNTGNASPVSATVLSYSSPYASTFSPHRTLYDGTLDDTGGYFTVDYEAVISALNNLNAKQISVDYKLTSAGTWTNAYSATLGSYTESGTTPPTAISTDATYDIRIQLTDDFGTVTQTAKLSTIPATLDLLDGGTGAAFGKVAETTNLLEVAWNISTLGDLSVTGDAALAGNVSGRVLGLGEARGQILTGGNYNDWTDPGVYGIASDAIAATLSNAPDALGGTLRVWNGLGDSKDPGDASYYVLQEKTAHTGLAYRRKGVSNALGVITWESWVGKQEESGAGYCKLPEGTLIQWGQAGGYDGVTSKDFEVTMSYAFIDTNYIISVTSSLGSTSTLSSYDQRINTVVKTSTTKFTVHQRVLNGNPVNQFHWIAIGRWK